MGKYTIPPPSNWQDFEQYTRVLFECILKNTDVRKHGRQGQPQHGVDIFGYDRSHGKSKRMVAVQCKGKNRIFGGKLTNREIETEIEKVKGFKYPISAFYILTTAPRDAGIQAVVLEIEQEKELNFTVSVWGWEDIEERLWEDENSKARKCFDPFLKEFLESLPERLDYDEKDIENSKENYSDAQIKLQDYYEILVSGKPETAYDMLEKLEEKLGQDANKLDKYKILAYKGMCLLEIGEFEKSAQFFLDAYDIYPERKGADARKVIALAFLGKSEEAVKFGESAIANSEDKEMLAANIIHAKINLLTEENAPFQFLLDKISCVFCIDVDLRALLSGNESVKNWLLRTHKNRLLLHDNKTPLERILSGNTSDIEELHSYLAGICYHAFKLKVKRCAMLLIAKSQRLKKESISFPIGKIHEDDYYKAHIATQEWLDNEKLGRNVVCQNKIREIHKQL